MATDNLEVYIGGTWRKDQADFAKVADSMVADIDRIVNKGKSIRIDLGGAGSGEFKKGMDEAKRSTEDLTKVQRQLADALIRLQQLESEEQKQLIATREEIRKKTQDIKNEDSEYKRLAATYATAALKAKDLAIAHGVESRQAKEAAKSAYDLRVKLFDAEKSVGQFQRQVGNYNAVGESFNQLLREAPNFANGFRVVISALGNNFTYFIEAVKKARDEGQSFSKILGTIGSSAFGLVGIVNIAYAAFAIFAEKIFASGDAAEKAKDKLEDYKSTLDGLITSTKEYNGLVQLQAGNGEGVLKRRLELLKAQGATEKDIADAADALHDRQVENLREEERVYKAIGEAFTRLKGNKNDGSNVNAQVLEDEVSSALPSINRQAYLDEIKKALDEGVDLTDYYINKQIETEDKISEKNAERDTDTARRQKTILDKQQKEAEAAAKKRQAIAQAVTEAQSDLERKQALAAIAIEREDLERTALNYKKVADDTEHSFDKRFEALNFYYDYKRLAEESDANRTSLNIQQENIDAEESARKRKLTEEEKADVIKRSAKQIEEVYKTSNNKILDIEADRVSGVKKLNEDEQKERLRIIIQGAQDIENANRGVMNAELTRLNEEYEAKRISEKKYQAERKRIIKLSNEELAAAQTAYFRTTIDEMERAGTLTKEIADKLRSELSKLTTGDLSGTNGGKDTLAKALGLDKESLDEISKSVSYFGGLIGEIQNVVDEAAQARISALEAEKEHNKELFEQQYEQAELLALTEEERQKAKDEGLTNEEYKNNKLADLKARNSLAELAQDRRIVDAKRRQARADKAYNIAQTVGKTGIAILGAFADLGPIAGAIAAIAIGAIGVAQIAAISSQPLPEYYKGTQSAERGYAKVGERGAELIQTKDGLEIADVPAIRYMEGGERVFTAEETSRMIKNGALQGGKTGSTRVREYMDTQAMINAYYTGSKRVENAIKGQKTTVNVVVQDKGYEKFMGTY